MKIPTIAALLVSLLALPGCIYVPPVWDVGDEIYSVDQIKEGVTTKQQVLDTLGEPDYETENTFRYRGSTSGGFFIVGNMIQAWGGLINEEHWWVEITFDENGVVRELITSAQPTEIRKQKLQQGAEAGDAKSQFEMYALSASDTEAWKWLCLSANQGHIEAQYKTGLKYVRGTEGPPRDLVQAYMWYSLAAVNGHKLANWARDKLPKKMTSKQLADAEQLVKEWKPDPASCEAEGKAASK